MPIENTNQIQSITLFDSYLRQEMQLTPETTVEKGKLKIYSCGPTVYHYQHIGNVRATWLGDTIASLAKIAGYDVEWVQNITDVGHLVDDGDDGEDKLEKGARREGKGVREIVDYYTNDFRVQCQALNITLPIGKMNPKATEYIPEQMILALDLLKSNKAYLLEDGIYYDSEWDKSNDSPLEGWTLKEDGVLTSDKVLDQIIEKIQTLQTKNDNKPFIIAIDGLAGSGKTVFSKKLTERLENAKIVKFDKFQFEEDLVDKLKAEHKSFKINFKENYDYQKIVNELILPFKNSDSKILIIEGCYTFLIDYEFDFKIWLDLPLEIAKERAILRESQEQDGWSKEDAKAFYDQWDKFEKENYQDTFKPDKKADLIISTQNENYEILLYNKNYTGRDIKNTTKNPQDFALWKFVEENSLQKWRFEDFPRASELVREIYYDHCKLPNDENYEQESILGLQILDIEKKWGCPGWHSECVAMICCILGSARINTQNLNYFRFSDFGKEIPVIDIHTGGEDHIEIHHKNEILQSEALGFHLSKYWVHNKFVLVDSKKMAKSVGNVYLVQGKFTDTGFYSFDNPAIHELSEEFKLQIAKKYTELKLIKSINEMDWESFKFDPLAYRMMLMEHHYTEQMNFTWEKLWQSQMRLWGLRKEAAKINIKDEKIDLRSQSKFNLFIEILADNLDISRFLETYQSLLSDTAQVEDLVNSRILNFLDHNFLKLNIFSFGLESSIIDLAESRKLAKDSKDYSKSDEIRSKIQALGCQIDDYSNGWGLWWRGDI